MSGVILLGPAERSQVAKLLDMLCEMKRPCAICRRMIWFIRTPKNSLMPVDDDAVSHFASCTDPARFRRAKT